MAKVRTMSLRTLALSAAGVGLVAGLVLSFTLVLSLRGKVAGLVTENGALQQKAVALQKNLDAQKGEQARLAAALEEEKKRSAGLESLQAARPPELRFRLPLELSASTARPRPGGVPPVLELPGIDRPVVLEAGLAADVAGPFELVLFSDSGSIAWSGGGLAPVRDAGGARLELTLPADTLRLGAGYELRVEARGEAGITSSGSARFRVAGKKK